MAEEVKIGDIAKQLSTASRLVLTTDAFWVYTADGTQVKIPAEFVRAYLTNGITPSIGSDGTWQIGGTSTGITAEGVSPKLKSSEEGILVSYDSGKTWQTLALWGDLDVNLDGLVAEYQKIVGSEEGRVSAEKARVSAESSRASAESTRKTNETARQSAESTRASNEETRKTSESARVSAETSRASAEKTRESNETARQSAEGGRVSAETARAKAETARVSAEKARETASATAVSNAETATKAANTATDNANDTANHPTKIGDDYYVYVWNKSTQAYDKTTIYTKGDAFSVSKVFASVAEMNAYTGTDIKAGDFVVINTGNPEEEDDAKLYVKGEDGTWQFIVDMSGFRGFTGKTPQISIGSVTSGTTSSASLSANGTDSAGNPCYLLNLCIAKGEKGDKGDKGDTGDNGKSPKAQGGTWWEYDDTKGEYVNTNISVNSDYELTKAKVEAVLTGDISSHTHSAYAAKSHTHTKSDITDLSLDWSKIENKPTSYDPSAHTHKVADITDLSLSWDAVTGKPSTFTPSSHTHKKSEITDFPTKVSAFTNDSGYLTAHQDISGKQDKLTDAQMANINADHSTYAKATDLSSEVTRAKAAEATKAEKSHKHTKSEITDFPTSLPASDVYSWAKASTKPSYTASEVGAAASSHKHTISDISNLPTVPTKTSQLTNDSGFITLDDLKETVHINLTCDNTASDLNGATVTVKVDGSVLGTYTWNGSTISVKINDGKSVSVSVSAVNDYSTPAEQTFTATTANNRNVTFAYTYKPLGVRILDTDGNLTTSDNWSTSNNSKAVGVAVITSNCAFVIAPEDALSSDVYWASNTSSSVSGVTTTTDSATAKQDYNGEANTAAMLAVSSSTSYPAGACNAYTFKNGKKGYLMSCGEAQAMLDNKNAITTAMSKMGGTALSSYYWTSTQYNASSAWGLYWSNGGVYSDGKSSYDCVRAVCAF